MMSGCISCDGVGRLAKVDGRMNSQGYISLFRKELLPFLTSMGPDVMFMDDNAPCHRARTSSSSSSSSSIPLSPYQKQLES